MGENSDEESPPPPPKKKGGRPPAKASPKKKPAPKKKPKYEERVSPSEFSESEAEGNSSDEEEQQSSDFEPDEGEYKAKKPASRGVRGSPAKSKYVDPDSDEDFDQPTERLDLAADQTKDQKIAPLVGKKIRGNYETGWHYGKIEYFNVKMGEYKVSFADGLDPDYIKEDDIDGVDIILLDDDLPTNGNDKSGDKKKGDSEGESDQEGSDASDEEAGSGTENKRSTKVLDDNSKAKAAITTPTKKKGGSSGEESENNESDEEEEKDEMEENSEIPAKTTLQA